MPLNYCFSKCCPIFADIINFILSFFLVAILTISISTPDFLSMIRIVHVICTIYKAFSSFEDSLVFGSPTGIRKNENDSPTLFIEFIKKIYCTKRGYNNNSNFQL